ncbi:uncharacterized protein EI97DRAFT_461110 [Westerdykella ornata]|uniref:Uncharacterized protein n=1 Tax=Westerdykella ornata TaxID=318751 RepID=A0A6A6JA41_WESOR|nr:uncharacterized protein EI97DRAFT_461110 [Westerdykella ornata]KAF2273451.1 hypothetical protein EI97DRAFT_461110 [Westerdykella ornata]
MTRDIIPFSELYGENWSRPNFDPHFDNIRTRTKYLHHCSQCRKIPKRSCYTKGHMAFCTVHIKDKDSNWVRHGQRFTVQSGGCDAHPRVQGYNHAIADAFKTGVPAGIEAFDEYDRRDERAELTADAHTEPRGDTPATGDAESILAEADAEAEDQIEKGEYDPEVTVKALRELANRKKWAEKDRRKGTSKPA